MYFMLLMRLLLPLPLLNVQFPLTVTQQLARFTSRCKSPASLQLAKCFLISFFVPPGRIC